MPTNRESNSNLLTDDEEFEELVIAEEELVDAYVRNELSAGDRKLLERALLDTDAWTRWKALRGLVGLGIEPSRGVVAPLAADPDFRVRLEAAGALRVRG